MHADLIVHNPELLYIALAEESDSFVTGSATSLFKRCSRTPDHRG